MPTFSSAGAEATGFYELSGPNIWGDYGPLLIGGDWERDSDGVLRYSRAGPVAPPIALPDMGVIVAGHEFRKALEGSGLHGLAFCALIKKRIVEFHWERWDRTSNEIGELPKLDDPFNLLLEYPHSEEAARAVGTLWEARTQRLAEVVSINKRAPWEYDLQIQGDLEPLRGIDFFGAKRQDRVIVSERAKQWLETNVPEWVSFRRVYTEGEQRTSEGGAHQEEGDSASSKLQPMVTPDGSLAALVESSDPFKIVVLMDLKTLEANRRGERETLADFRERERQLLERFRASTGQPAYHY